MSASRELVDWNAYLKLLFDRSKNVSVGIIKGGMVPESWLSLIVKTCSNALSHQVHNIRSPMAPGSNRVKQDASQSMPNLSET